MLRPLGLTYKVEDEVLLITSPQASLRETFPKTYYVGDLIMPPGKPAGNPADPKSNYNPQTPTQTDPNRLQAQTVTLANGATSIVRRQRRDGDRGRAAQGGHDAADPVDHRLDRAGHLAGQRPLGQRQPPGPTAWAAASAAATPAASTSAQPIGSITPFFLSISLIIRHTAEIHDQVADLLRQLRRLQDLQVSIEVRFITVSDTFFEQIGVDFDFDIQSKTVGKHSTFAVPNPATSIFPNTPGLSTTTGTTDRPRQPHHRRHHRAPPAPPATTSRRHRRPERRRPRRPRRYHRHRQHHRRPVPPPRRVNPYIVNPIRDYSLGNRLPLTVGTSSVGAGGVNFTPNLAMPFTQGSGALAAPTFNARRAPGPPSASPSSATWRSICSSPPPRATTRTNILQAPKVTTFNGAPATIINTEQLNFVESLIPIVGPGSVAFLPTVASFPNGVQLLVTPVVSADRRYVRMTLSPVFTAIEGFDTIQVPAAVGGSGLGGGSAAINGTIQLPRFNFTTVSTTVTVPDGGTVLLGGVKRLNEERKEFGVPVLSKTPLINRLFRNVGIGRVTSSLMLMVTPRIIILEEEEERLGIPTVTQ